VKCIYAYMLINPKLKKQNEAEEADDESLTKSLGHRAINHI